ncbi:hypothetical protein C1146_11005 [Clostridium botulinum]|nr:hypothetical protein C1146_11005 [Clostridium botulinum]
MFIGFNVALRADESIPFYIGYKSNTEDGVINLTQIKNIKFTINNEAYSIYINIAFPPIFNTINHFYKLLIHISIFFLNVNESNQQLYFYIK